MRKILLIVVLHGAALALLLAACKAPDGAETARAGAGASNAASTPPAAAPAAPAPSAPYQQQAPHTGDNVRRVTPAEARGMVERGEAVIVDVRGKADYDNGHIKGSLLFPRGELKARAGELPKDKLIVFYCA